MHGYEITNMKIKDENVWWFFLITIGFSWLFELPRTLDSQGIVESPKLLLRFVGFLPPWGPFIAAFILTYLSHGKNGMIRLLKRGWDTTFKKIWWIPILLLLPIMEGLAVILAKIFGGEKYNREEEE